MFRKIRRDAELATDEKTMLYINPTERKNYGLTLIDTLSMHSGKSITLLGMANNKQDIRKRITAIAKFKKPNMLQHISGVSTVLLIASVCLTSTVIARPISDIIYEKVPEIIVGENQPEPKTAVIENNAEPIVSPTEVVEAEKTTEETYIPENSSIDTMIISSGQNIYTGTDTVDMTNYANQIGIINGNGDGTFAPEEKVTNEQIVKMLVCVLGYEPAVRGSYPTAHFIKATELGITKGLDLVATEVAKRKDVAVMIHNALDIPIMVQTGFGEFTQ